MSESLGSGALLLERAVSEARRRMPDRVLVAAESVRLYGRGGPASVFQVECAPAGEGVTEARVTAEEGEAVLSARLMFDHVHPVPRLSGAQGPRTTNPPGSPNNGRRLYALDEERPVDVPEALQVVQWARARGLGEMVGEVLHRASFPGIESAEALHSAPGTLEGMLQISRWLWYAFSGEGGRPVAADRITWFRLPRQGESVRVEAFLSGTHQELPVIELCGLSAEGAPLVQVRSLRLEPYSLCRSPELPRRAWQDFMKVV